MKAYEGPELPKSEIAVLHHAARHDLAFGLALIVPFPCFKHETLITEIDGKHKQPGTEIHIRPGEHTAIVQYVRHFDVTPLPSTVAFCLPSYFSSDLSIKFTTKAGHEYRIPAERRGARNWIWVEDITTGKVVAGEKPPDDKKAKGKEPATPPEEP